MSYLIPENRLLKFHLKLFLRLSATESDKCCFCYFFYCKSFGYECILQLYLQPLSTESGFIKWLFSSILQAVVGWSQEFFTFLKDYLHLLNNLSIRELLRILIFVSGSHFLALSFLRMNQENKRKKICNFRIKVLIFAAANTAKSS